MIYLGDLGFPIEASTIIHCDNQSEIQVTDNPITHSKMKHIELHAHYLRQLIQEKIVTLFYCRTNDQLADIFMKLLSEAKFVKFHALLGI